MLRNLTNRFAGGLRAAALTCALAMLGAAGAVVTGAPATAQTAFAPAAIVNEDVITYYDVVQRARILEVGGATAGPALNRAALDQLIDDRLRMQVGERFNIQVSEDEILLGLNELGSRQNMDAAALVASLTAQGIDEVAIRDVVASQIAWNRVITGRFNDRAAPTEIELDNEIAIAASATETRFRLAEIALPADASSQSRAEAYLNRLRTELAAGASFADMARRESRSPTAKQGGEIGWVPQSSLPPVMAAELGTMRAGQVSNPVTIPGGVAIFLLMETEVTAPGWANITTYSLQRISVPVGTDAAPRASAIAASAKGCGDLPELEADVSTARLNEVTAASLAPDLRAALDGLDAGGVSAPVANDNTVDVYLVCSKRTGAAAEVREQVREQIRSQRLTRFAEGFLQELRRDAVIEQR